MHCTMNGHNVEALADSGSDIDVVSLDLVLEQGWKIREIDQDVILAMDRGRQLVESVLSSYQ